MFDQDVSKAFVVVKDFRVSETSMDGDSSNAERSGTEVDPADTTAVVRWDYALDLMTPENISQVVTEFPSQDRLAEVFVFQISVHATLRSLTVILTLLTDSQDGTP